MLGTGGMGTVYRARDGELGVDVAVKAVRHASPQAFYRLKAEFRALADLRHRNLVRLGELYGGEGEWFFSMELIQGPDFLSWARRPARAVDSQSRTLPPPPPDLRDTERHSPAPAPPAFDEPRLRGMLGQLASGLEALHRTNRVHRDVKPSNVLIEAETGRLVLLDFGLTRLVHRRTTESGHQIVGTVGFMAPEVAEGNDPTAAADWYGVGAMLYEVLTGRLPFEGQPLQVLAQKVRRDPAPPSTHTRDIPADLEHLCLSLLEREPSSRAGGPGLRRAAGTSGLRSASVQLPIDEGPFVGRRRELAALRKAFEDGRSGRPVMVRLVGESGVGKTVLARRFVDDLADAQPRLVLLDGRCYAHELVPYKAWDGVVDAITRELRRIEGEVSSAHAAWLLPKDVHALARVFPVLGRVPAIAELIPPDESLVNPDRLRRRAFDALRELLRNLGREGPVVVWIDDFHWADRDSRLLLEDLLVPLDAPPLLLITTERPGGTGESAVPARRLSVSPLPQEDARELARELAAMLEGRAPTDLEGVVQESGGHPFFLQQLLRQVGEAGGPTPRLDDMIRRRVSRLDPDARRLLELVCVSGIPLDLAVVAAATNFDVATCRRLADALESEQLLRGGPDDAARLQPYHDRVRESVVDALGLDQLPRHHAALASALARGGVSGQADQDVVRHLAEAGQREQAARAAEVAAALAERSLAFDRASELYRMALSFGRHAPDKRLALRLALSSALANAGHGALEAAQGFLEAADAQPNADEALSLRTRALEQLAMSGSTQQALELLRQLCIDVGVSLPRSRIGAVLSLIRRRIQIRAMGLPKSIPRFEGETVAASPAQQLYLAAFMHLPILDPLLANELHARILAGALRSGDVETLALCLCREAGVSLSFNERRYVHAEHSMQLAKQVFGDSPHPDHRAWLLAGDGLRQYFLGHFDTALSQLHAGQDVWSAEAESYVMNVSQLAVFTMGSLRYLGNINELRREFEQARRDAEWRGNKYLWTVSTIAFQLAILLQDGLEASRRDMSRLDLESSVVRTGSNRWYLARAEAEEALYEGANIEELRRHIRILSRFLRTQYGLILTWGSDLRWLLGRLWLAVGDAGDPRGTKKAKRLAKALLRRRLTYARVWGRALLAGVLMQQGNRVACREALEDCAVRAELNGFMLVAEAARVRLGEHGFGNEEAHREALAFFDTQRVCDLEATMRLLMPGFAAARDVALPSPPLALPSAIGEG